MTIRLIICILLCFNCTAFGQTDSIRITLAEQYLSNGNYKLALVYADTLQQDFPENISIAVFKARVLKELGKTNEANKLINKAMDTTKVVDMEYYYHRAEQKIIAKLYKDAEHDLKKALKIANENSSLYKEVLFNMGEVHYNLLEYQKTHDDMQLFLAHWPDDEHGLLLMCNALNWLNSTGEIMMYLERGIKLYPKSTLMLGNLAYRYQNKGDYEKAIELNTNAIALTKEDDACYYYNNRGYEKYKLNNFTGAMEDMNKALEIDSTNSYIHRNKALVYIALQDMASACAELNKAIEKGFNKMYGTEANDLKNKYCR
jgi:tetratricopeptide (TPR) repeat protein